MITTGSQRGKFDIPPGIAYFNTAANAPQLNASRAALTAAAGAKSHPWERLPDDFFADANRLRALSAGLFGGDVDGYAVVPSASYGISTAARAIEPMLKPGDRIVVLAEEFPSNVLPWRRVAKETGATIVTVPMPADGDWTSATLATLDTHVRVASLPHCHWTNGAVLDLEAVSEACRANHTALVLDVTQSLGAMPLDLDTIRPDFFVAAGYKWLLCPYGFGLLYVAPQWRDARPLEESWLARANGQDFSTLIQYSDAYMPGARRFDVGEVCVTTLLPGAIAALEQLSAWGIGAIGESLAAINTVIADRLGELGCVVPTPASRSPHLLGARPPTAYSGDLIARLRARGVFVSQRGASIRFAPHLHITPADIDQLCAALDEAFA
jgi:selenocysteine lyase/cysteine desulfurase